MRGYPRFTCWIPITLAKICSFPIVITCTKIPLYQEELSLRVAGLVQLDEEYIVQGCIGHVEGVLDHSLAKLYTIREVLDKLS